MKLKEPPVKKVTNYGDQSTKDGKRITKPNVEDLDADTDKKLKSKTAPKKSIGESPDELSSLEARPDPQKIKKTEAGVSKTVGAESKPIVSKSTNVKIAAAAKSAPESAKKVKLALPVDHDQSSEEKVTSKIMSPDAKHGAKHTDELDHQEVKIVADFCAVGELIANRFEIKDKVRRGGFGQIYTACDLRTKDSVVLKVEELNNIVSEMEAHVLEVFQMNKHCPKLYASGSTPIYRFVVMQHLGHNLSDLRRRCSLRPYRLSISSSFRAILECLKAVEGLHTLGYLHRDLKPSNFAISLKPDDDSIIYMLDYGLCRYYLTKEGAIRPPRLKLGFRGTVRYASVASHQQEELSRRDDLWSIFYMLYELTTGLLPWKMYGDIKIVHKMKVKFSPEILCKALPEGLGSFVDHVRSLKYEDRPSYKLLLNCLVCILMKIGAVLDYLYDWQVDNCGQRFLHWEIPEMNNNDLPMKSEE